ncbi:hypothetical protein Y1Q_0010300 [Alligator mississippiensis]|uniref:Uncharacterized protein n=1 Tax=Alligator mississippiensis TaxID=8496 RepID=A0A151NM37_ALLMI|nr:hypothetical protein Y1Q_0010300 [Alligator mississippiensis]
MLNNDRLQTPTSHYEQAETRRTKCSHNKRQLRRAREVLKIEQTKCIHTKSGKEWLCCERLSTAENPLQALH